jgi:hypothetical protein
LTTTLATSTDHKGADGTIGKLLQVSRQRCRSSAASSKEEDAARGRFRDMKRRKAYEKPSARKTRSGERARRLGSRLSAKG